MLFGRRCCGMNMHQCGCQRPQMECPIVEPTINKCVEKEFYHEVPQV